MIRTLRALDGRTLRGDCPGGALSDEVSAAGCCHVGVIINMFEEHRAEIMGVASDPPASDEAPIQAAEE